MLPFNFQIFDVQLFPYHRLFIYFLKIGPGASPSEISELTPGEISELIIR